jgi:hypothetical protein
LTCNTPHPRQAAQSTQRRDIDDGTTAPFNQIRDGCLHDQKRPGQVYLDHLSPEFGIKIGYRPSWIDSRIIHHHIEPAFKGQRPRHHSLDILDSRHVSRTRRDAPWRQCLSHLVEHFLAAAGDADLRPLRNKPFRNGSPYARSSSGNQCYLSFQFHGLVSLSCILISSSPVQFGIGLT